MAGLCGKFPTVQAVNQIRAWGVDINRSGGLLHRSFLSLVFRGLEGPRVNFPRGWAFGPISHTLKSREYKMAYQVTHNPFVLDANGYEVLLVAKVTIGKGENEVEKTVEFTADLHDSLTDAIASGLSLVKDIPASFTKTDLEDFVLNQANRQEITEERNRQAAGLRDEPKAIRAEIQRISFAFGAASAANPPEVEKAQNLLAKLLVQRARLEELGESVV